MMRPDRQNHPPTSQDGEGGDHPPNPWLKKARDAYDASTSYLDTNFRKQWEDAIRAFHSQHPADSKYSSPAYAKRSSLYRPKTRTVIRKNEAASAAAFFSNLETVSLQARDQSSRAQLISAEVMKALLDYRLEETIPWFLFVQGGIQDAQTVGASCAHVYWDFAQHEDEESEEEAPPQAIEKPIDPENPIQGDLPAGAFTMGQPPEAALEPQAPKQRPPKISVDKPCMDLIPIENIRIDPAANWMDPVGTSPYFIHLIPMYVMDVKGRIEKGEWLEVSEGMLSAAASVSMDTTRTARQKDRDDPQGTDTRGYSDIDIVWVQRHIHRDGHRGDVEFYVLGDGLAMLSEPQPLVKTVFHGRRPYVIGTYILEAHRILSSGLPQVSKGLQDEANEIANQRIDNVKFVLNKKWFVKRGKEVDIPGLMRNVPGGAVMMDDVDKDVREISWQDVTASSFEEQRNLNLDMDELVGNFNPAALIMHGGGNAPARNMAMLNTANAALVEYGIRTYVETFIQPCLKLLILCEQKYETDRTLLAICAKKSKLFQRFGIDEVTDELLNQHLTLRVQVGMGATDPTAKLQKLLTGLMAFSNVMKAQIPGMNAVEVGKEIFAYMGYTDASRFFTTDNPQVSQLQNMLQQAKQIIEQQDKKLKEKQTQQVVGLQKTRETNASKERQVAIQEEAANKRALATHITALMGDNHSHEREKEIIAWTAKHSPKTNSSAKNS